MDSDLVEDHWKRLRLSPNEEDAVECNVDHFEGLETNN